MHPKEDLIEYLLSDEYIYLLERAILARLGTTTYNVVQHTKAYELLIKFKEWRE